MLELPSAALDNLTGSELVALVTEARRSNGKNPNDLEIDGRRWKLYILSWRGRIKTVHLWREVQMPLVIGGVDTGQTITDVVHLRGSMSERVEQMRAVD